jgi:hypothetical protein
MRRGQWQAPNILVVVVVILNFRIDYCALFILLLFIVEIVDNLAAVRDRKLAI